MIVNIEAKNNFDKSEDMGTNFGNAAHYYKEKKIAGEESSAHKRHSSINLEDVEVPGVGLISENSAIYKKKKARNSPLAIRRSENNRSRESNFQNDDIKIGSSSY